MAENSGENPSRFDKTHCVLDAAGGPQDLLSGFSLITITKRKAFWTRSKATQPVGALPQSGKDQSRPNYALYKITNPQPPAGGLLLAHPEDWFKPLFDKTQSVLDAKGGPQDLLSDFSLIAINPDSPSNNPTSNQRKGFYKPPANPTLVKK